MLNIRSKKETCQKFKVEKFRTDPEKLERQATLCMSANQSSYKYNSL